MEQGKPDNTPLPREGGLASPLGKLAKISDF